MRKRPSIRSATIGPATTVAELARSTILNTLTGADLAVYLRLVVLAAERGNPIVRVYNDELYPVTRTALRALDSLHGAKLIRVRRGTRHGDRTIEVCR